MTDERCGKVLKPVERLVQRLADELGIQPWQAANAVELLDAENTIPFIARYRKERTGELDEELLRRLSERLAALRALEARRAEITRLLEAQGALTPSLQEAIENAGSLQRLEDLYRPYRPKRKTRGQAAREKGLAPLARCVLGRVVPQALPSGSGWEELAAPFVDPEKGVASADEALSGALDIVAEVIADDPEIRDRARRLLLQRGRLRSECALEEGEARRTEYEAYYDFSVPVSKVRPYQVLAVNRGETEGVLRVRIEVETDALISAVRNEVMRRPLESFPSLNATWPPSPKRDEKLLLPLLNRAIADACRRLLGPAVERDVRSHLTAVAEEHAVGVFASNLRQLLMQPPIEPAVVIGIDPAYRTGCKVAVVGPTGEVLATTTIYPHPPQSKWDEALDTLQRLAREHRASVVAIGNGTASRETERLVAELIRKERSLRYLVVNEAGASVYSASPLAKEELPGLDVTLRGAVSIARRVLDPLAELVKIDPKSIGVGLYQHDVDPKRLGEALHGVVESCVNFVGVELNTASEALLRYVSGISAPRAAAIVAYRRKIGRFESRSQLLEVSGIGTKTFEQCAGFLRIAGGSEPLDNTGVHPESYPAARRLLERIGATAEELGQLHLAERLAQADLERLAVELGIGLPTLKDIAQSLARPGRDPREDLPPPLFRTDLLELSDLKPGMVLQGQVTNVVDFGAFVDIGVKKAGLVHVSEMSDGYVAHPFDVLSVGDVVTVRVLEVDLERERIALSMRRPHTHREGTPEAAQRPRGEQQP